MAAQGQALAGCNLDERAQNRRLRIGVLSMAVALTSMILVVELDVARAWRALLVFPFGLAAFGILQGLYRTCPGAAARGMRELNDEQERIANPEDLLAVRRLARKVMFGSAAFAVAATSVVWLLP